jgi:deoxyribodipyrimidine photo-lyase
MNKHPGTAIFWLRRDFRLQDNPAFYAASQHEKLVILYIWSPEEHHPWQPGAANKVWLHHTLNAFELSLKSQDYSLSILKGPYLSALLQAAEPNTSFYWNRRYEPHLSYLDSQIKTQLQERGHTCKSFIGNLLTEPWEILKDDKTPYLVYSPYWRAFLKQPLRSLTPTPQPTSSLTIKGTLTIKDLALLPSKPWHTDFPSTIGEAQAHQKLKDFLSQSFSHYKEQRDIPGIKGTSSLSPHLHFGEISPRQIFALSPPMTPHNETYFKEILWREFSYYLLFHFPHTALKPLRPAFENFPWNDLTHLKAWQQGQTGYPIVDAGMRELWNTGWMHNRVRMIVASFLVKHLRIPWQQGALWFWDTLLDADLASNSMGWQWSAGCGADAAPYFRIFNPQTQGEKFDPDGLYVKKWCPELTSLTPKFLHSPQNLKPLNYPAPIIDHKQAREAALQAFSTIRKKD